MFGLAETASGFVQSAKGAGVPAVEQTNPDGVDFGWVMQVTFVTTILVGSPVVVVLSALATLPTWASRAMFAVRVGAVVWFCTAVAVYLYARYRR